MCTPSQRLNGFLMMKTTQRLNGFLMMKTRLSINRNRSTILPTTNPNNTSSHHSKSSPSLGKRSRLEYQGHLVRSKSLKSSLCYLADKSFSHQRRKLSFKSQNGSWGQFVQNDIDEEERMLRKLTLSCYVIQ